MDLDAAVVVNEAQFSKFVHEETHARPGRADHLRKRLLADFRDYRLRFVFLAKVRQQQEQTGKTFLTRIEQLIDEWAMNSSEPVSGRNSLLTGNFTKIGPFGETLPVRTQQNQLVADNSLQNETGN